jgi:hypothetical protein
VHVQGPGLIVRRTVVGPPASLWPDWRHFAFLTLLEGPATDLEPCAPSDVSKARDFEHGDHSVTRADLRHRVPA